MCLVVYIRKVNTNVEFRKGLKKFIYCKGIPLVFGELVGKRCCPKFNICVNFFIYTTKQIDFFKFLFYKVFFKTQILMMASHFLSIINNNKNNNNNNRYSAVDDSADCLDFWKVNFEKHPVLSQVI